MEIITVNQYGIIEVRDGTWRTTIAPNNKPYLVQLFGQEQADLIEAEYWPQSVKDAYAALEEE